MRKLTILAVLATAALARPALAAENAVSVSDPCGDNKAGYEYDGQGKDFPEVTGNRASFDAKQLTVAQTATGVRATFEMCGAIPASSTGLNGWRAAYTLLTKDCELVIGVEEGVLPQRQASFAKVCFKEYDGSEAFGTPLDPSSDTRFDITLPASALAVNGATMTVDVARAGLTGEAAQALAAGTTWTGLQVGALEGTTLSGFGVSMDNQGNSHSWAWAAPFNYDFGYANTALTLT